MFPLAFEFGAVGSEERAVESLGLAAPLLGWSWGLCLRFEHAETECPQRTTSALCYSNKISNHAIAFDMLFLL